ncbi:hypothetical protein MTO96_045421 [Rhipicephalus appendiculatus]
MTEQSQQYAAQLARHNWRNFCDKLQGTLGTKQVQRLLRALVMEGLTKMSTKNTTTASRRKTNSAEYETNSAVLSKQ